MQQQSASQLQNHALGRARRGGPRNGTVARTNTKRFAVSKTNAEEQKCEILVERRATIQTVGMALFGRKHEVGGAPLLDQLPNIVGLPSTCVNNAVDVHPHSIRTRNERPVLHAACKDEHRSLIYRIRS